ncbi:MAG: choice-of-anchor D domain-containing protein [Bacteroidota bacterium]
MRSLSLLVALLLAAPAWAQTQIYQQSFEDGTGYTTSIAEYTDGFSDFFARTDTSDVTDSYQIDGFDGNWIFAAQDIDSEGAELPVTLVINDIDISDVSNLSFRGLFAEDDASNGDEDWDNDGDFVHIKYRIDSDDMADLQNLIWFEAGADTSASGFNGSAAQDTDFDGIGDGPILTPTLTEFTAAIAGTGSTLDIFIAFSLNSGDEDIAMDNLRIFGDVLIATEPEIEVGPSMVDFGMVEVGTSAQQMVTITNEGDGILQIGEIDVTGDGFSFVGTPPSSVAPGASEMVTVQFAPMAAGPAMGTLSIASNDADEPTVNVSLSGTGQTPAAPEIDVTPLTLDFGGVDVGSTADLMVTVSNAGDADLIITGATEDGDAFSIASALPGPIAPGGSAMITIRFAPAAIGPAAATLTITSNDADEGSVEVALSGTGQDVIVPMPEINVTPSSIDFGTVTTGQSAQRTVTITNEGDGDLTIAGIELPVSDNDFAVIDGGAPGTVEPGASRVIVLVFSPSNAVSFSTTLTITSDDADEGTVDVPLSGTGEDPVIGACDYTFAANAKGSLTVPSEGGRVRFAFTLDNSGSDGAATVDIWGAVINDIGAPSFIRTPRTPTVPGGAIYEAGYNQRIPGFAEDGVYTYIISAGTFNADDPASSEVCGSAVFTVTKGSAPSVAGRPAVSTDASAGKAASEPIVWGDSEIVDEEITQAAFFVSGDEIRVGPNPTRGTATFGFAMAEAGDAHLALYDVRGREVATVVDGPLRAGAHTATLGERLPAGVYVWRLRAGDRVETGRLTVIR